MLARHIWSNVHAPTCQATGSFSFAFTLPGQAFSSDSQTKMSPFSSFMILFGTGVDIEASPQCENSCKLKEMMFVMFFLHYTLSQVAAQTYAFVRKGETTHLLISLVSLMFSVPWKIFWHAISLVGHFVCILYNYGFCIKPLRYERFPWYKAYRKIHPKIRKLISAIYHYAEMH